VELAENGMAFFAKEKRDLFIIVYILSISLLLTFSCHPIFFIICEAFCAFIDTCGTSWKNPPSFLQFCIRIVGLNLFILRGMSDVTRILEKLATGGHSEAANELLSLIYDELRDIARSKMAKESPGHTLRPTALVNEAYSKLFPEGRNPKFTGRPHFFAAAATAMQRILVDHARRKKADKRDGGNRVDLPDSQMVEVAHPAPPDEILAVDEALKRLAAQDQISADVVTFHYFVGMTMRETADALDISKRQAERFWAFAKAWLRRELGKDLKS
jgi:RNA polymerase sigma factor (TIGR02999 family)